MNPYFIFHTHYIPIYAYMVHLLSPSPDFLVLSVLWYFTCPGTIPLLMGSERRAGLCNYYRTCPKSCLISTANPPHVNQLIPSCEIPEKCPNLQAVGSVGPSSQGRGSERLHVVWKKTVLKCLLTEYSHWVINVSLRSPSSVKSRSFCRESP